MSTRIPVKYGVALHRSMCTDKEVSKDIPLGAALAPVPEGSLPGQGLRAQALRCPTNQSAYCESSASTWGPPAASGLAPQQGHQIVSAPFHFGRATSRIESVTLLTGF